MSIFKNSNIIDFSKKYSTKYVGPSYVPKNNTYEHQTHCSYAHGLDKPCYNSDEKDAFCIKDGKKVPMKDCYYQYGRTRMLGDDSVKSFYKAPSSKERSLPKLNYLSREFPQVKHRSIVFGKRDLTPERAANTNTFGDLPFKYKRDEGYDNYRSYKNPDGIAYNLYKPKTKYAKKSGVKLIDFIQPEYSSYFAEKKVRNQAYQSQGKVKGGGIGDTEGLMNYENLSSESEKKNPVSDPEICRLKTQYRYFSSDNNLEAKRLGERDVERNDTKEGLFKLSEYERKLIPYGYYGKDPITMYKEKGLYYSEELNPFYSRKGGKSMPKYPGKKNLYSLSDREKIVC